MDKQVEHYDEQGAHRERFVEVGDGAAIVDDALFHDGDEVENRAERKCAQRHAKQVFLFADQSKNGVQQTHRVQRGGHAQPDDAHFSHGRSGNVES